MDFTYGDKWTRKEWLYITIRNPYMTRMNNNTRENTWRLENSKTTEIW